MPISPSVPPERTRPSRNWSTSHTVALELNSVQLRDFTVDEDSPPALLCTPLALHGAAVADLTQGHSLVAALRRAGLRRLFAADWRSATPTMRFRGIDDYLADLNVLVDHIGAAVDLIGLCQGGWMALTYAARFPAKVRKLVLAGARSTSRLRRPLGPLFMLILLPMNMLSASNTPLESMLAWQAITMQTSPSTRFVSFAQAILYRGAGFDVVWPQFLFVAIVRGLFFVVAILRFRSTASQEA